MTINFTDLFTSLGAIGAQVADINTAQGTTIPTDVNAWSATYVGSQFAFIDGWQSQLNGWQQTQAGYLAFLQQCFQQTIIGYVYDDIPQLDLTIQSAMAELVNQMTANSQTVKTNTTSSVVTAGSGNLGNGVCVCSVYNGPGILQQYCFPELETLTCTQDSTNGATLNNELWTITGQVAQPSAFTLNWDWPAGSAATININTIDAQTNLGSGNLLYNSDFEAWTSNTPNGWTIVTGTAGTQVLQGGTVYTGTSSLEIVGDGSTLTCLEQELDSGTNTSVPSQVTQYGINFYARMSAAPAGGVLTVDLCDGSGTSILNQQGQSQSIVVTLSALSHTSWVNFNGVFQLPWILPSQVNLRINLTTALSSSRNLFIDQLSMGTMTQLYQGGPSYAIFAGSSPFYATVNAPDTFSSQISNNYGGASNYKTFQALFNRTCNMPSLGLQLPSTTGSPTISDALI